MDEQVDNKPPVPRTGLVGFRVAVVFSTFYMDSSTVSSTGFLFASVVAVTDTRHGY